MCCEARSDNQCDAPRVIHETSRPAELLNLDAIGARRESVSARHASSRLLLVRSGSEPRLMRTPASRAKEPRAACRSRVLPCSRAEAERSVLAWRESGSPLPPVACVRVSCRGEEQDERYEHRKRQGGREQVYVG